MKGMHTTPLLVKYCIKGIRYKIAIILGFCLVILQKVIWLLMANRSQIALSQMFFGTVLFISPVQPSYTKLGLRQWQ